MKTGKTFKKLMAMLLAVVMVVGLMPTAFAAETDVALTASLNNISGIANGTILAGEGLSAVLTAAEGYKLPENITVTGAGNFAYNKTSLTSATLTIDAAYITGDVTVSGDAVELKKYTVTWVLTDIKPQEVTEANEKDGLSVTLEAEEGYRLPNSIDVANATGNYNSATGELTVAGAAINDNITVTAEAVKTYDVDWSGLKNIAAPAETTVDAVNGLTVTLVADEHYSLPDENKITVTGVDTEGYTYTPSTGVLAINGAKVTGDVTVSAAAKADEFDVTVAADSAGYIEGVTSGKAAFNSTVEFTVKQRDGYAVDSITGVTAEYKTDHYEFTMPANAVELGVKWKFAAPAVTVNDSDGFKAEDGTVWFKLDDPAATEVKPVSPANSISKDNETWGDSVTGLSEGVNTVYIKDINDVQAEVQVGVDNTAPKASISYSGETDSSIWSPNFTVYKTTSKNAELTVNTEDENGSGVKSVQYYASSAGDGVYTLNDSLKGKNGKISNPSNELKGKNYVSLTNGKALVGTNRKYVLVIRAEDIVGNISYYAYSVEAVKTNANDKIAFSFEDRLDTRFKYHMKAFGTDTWLVYENPNQSGEEENIVFNISLDTDSALDDGESFKKENATIKLNNGEVIFDQGHAGWGQNEKYKTFSFGVNSGFFNTLKTDGIYDFVAKLKPLYTELTAKAKVFFCNTKPGATVTYKGMNGYDNSEQTFIHGGEAISDTVAPAAENALNSAYKLYTDGKGIELITFGEVSYQGDSSTTYPFESSVTINGAEGAAGFEVKKNKDNTKVESITVGEGAEDDEYTISYTVKGFNEKTQTINSTVVVDTVGPEVGQIIAHPFEKTVNEDKSETIVYFDFGIDEWTNKDIELSIEDINVEGKEKNLLDEPVSLWVGETQKEDAASKPGDDGVWKYSGISGEQNEIYTVKVKDKAGNITEKKFTAKIDTQKPASITTTTKGQSTDAELISDVFSFGVFHTDHNVILVAPKDAGSGDNVSGFDTVSGSKAVQYAFLTEGMDVYDNLRYEQVEKTPGVFEKEELDETAREVAVREYMADMRLDKLQWTDATVENGQFKTDIVPANTEFIALFAVTDKAGNTEFFERSFLIHDTVASAVTFTIDSLPVNAAELNESNTCGLYKNDISVVVNVEDPAAFSGVNSVSYKVYRCDEIDNPEYDEPFDSGFLLEEQYDLRERASNDEEDYVLVQGDQKFSKAIELIDNENGAIDSNSIFIVVSVEDLAGNVKEYYSNEVGITVTENEESHTIKTITIDKHAPEMTVTFDGDAVNGNYFGENRKADITIKDANFDPNSEDCLVIDSTGTMGEWEITETDVFGMVTYKNTVTFENQFDAHYFIVKELKDKAGNKGYNESQTADDSVDYDGDETHDEFFVDTEAPVAVLTFTRTDGKAFNEYNNCSVNVSVTVAEDHFDEGKATVTVNGAPVYVGWAGDASSHSTSFTLSEDNAYDVRVVVTDLAEHSSEPEEEHFVIDTVLPEIKISGVKDKSAYKAEKIIPVIDVTDTNYDGSGVEITLAGSNGGNGYYDAKDIDSGEKFTFENIEDDDMYTLTVTAKDLAENESAQTIVFSVNRNGSVFTANEVLAKAMENGIPYYRTDNLPKISIFETNVDIIKQAKLYLVKDSTGLDLTSNDYQAIRKDVNGGWSQYEYVLNSELFADDGVYRLSLVTVDAAGNEKNAEEVVAFVVDNTAPVLFANDLKSGGIYNEETKHVVFTPNDNIVLSRISVVLDGNEIASWDSEQIAQIIRDGGEFGFDVPESNALRNLSIVLTDAAGNTNENPLFENVLVSTNFFVRFYNNKPVFYSTIAGVVLIGGGLWFFLTKKKKEQDTETAEEEDI